MPILASSTYVHGYGKSALVAVESGPRILESEADGQDVFVVKYNTLGIALWSARIASAQVDGVAAIVTDLAGNVYVTGQGGSVVSIAAFNSDGTGFLPILPNSGSRDVFIIKYNTNGFVQWVARVGSLGNDISNNIATDSSGNVYVTGITGQAAVINAFNSDGSVFGTPLNNPNSTNVFIIKYNTNGFVQWFTRIGGQSGVIVNASLRGFGIATDSSGSVYVTGNTTSGLTVFAFNSDGTAFERTITGNNEDMFIVKYNTNGFVQWVARVGNFDNDLGYDVATDSSNNVYLTGRAGETTLLAFNSDGTQFNVTMPHRGSLSAAIVKYSTTGFVQWIAQVAPVTINTTLYSAIATDSGGNVYLTGQGGSNLVVTAYNSNGTAFATTIANSGLGDVFIIKYNTNGFVQWVARVASSSSDVGNGIATDSNDNVYVTGQTGPNPTTAFNFNGSPFATTFGNSGEQDAFVVKYNTSGVVQWLRRIASGGGDNAKSIAVDSNSNVYITGEFVGTQFTIYGQGLSLFSSTPNAGLQDAFIVKYNTNGSPQWVARIAGTSTDEGHAVATDSGGNLYVTGSYGGSAIATAFNSNGSPFGTTLANAGSSDAFIVKYNTSGFVQWVARVGGGVGTNEVGRGIATDTDDNVYVVGQGAGNLNAFNSNGPSFGTTLTNSGSNDAFIVKYNTDGLVQWVARIASTQSDIAFAVATDSGGNLYVTGSYGGSAVVTAFNSNGSPFGTTLANAGSSDAFIVKYNTNGFVEWLARVGSSGADVGRGIATDTNGNVYVVGEGAVNLNAFNSSGPSFGTTLPSAGLSDAFIVKYNTSGLVQWVARIGSTTADIGYDIQTDSAGNVYVVCSSGNTNNPMTIFNSDGAVFMALSNVAGDSYLVKYNTNGFAQWAARISGEGSTEISYSLDVDSVGNAYVTCTTTTIGIVSIFNSNSLLFAQVFGPVSIIKYDTNGFAQWFQALRHSTTTADPRGTTVDSTGNVYITGIGGSGTPLLVRNIDTTPYKVLNTIGAGTDAFVVKYSPNALPLWVARIAGGASNTSNEIVNAIATDSANNVYVTGTYGGLLTFFNFDDTVSVATLGTPFGTSDMFVGKYNQNGVVQWRARVSAQFNDSGVGIVTDTAGNVYAVGTYSGLQVSISNSNDTVFATRAGIDGIDIIVVKYNTDGFVQWVARLVSAGQEIASNIAIDLNGNVYIVGLSSNTVAHNFDDTPFSRSLANAGQNDGFVVKYNSNGSVQWLARISSTAGDQATGVATDSSGNVYVTGVYRGVLTSENSDGSAFSPQLPFSSSGSAAFIIKYNTSGLVQWNANIQQGTITPGGIATDSAGNVYVAITYSSGAAIRNLNNTIFKNLPSSGSQDFGIVKYNTNGAVQWATSLRTTSFADAVNGITTDSEGNVYITGHFGGVPLLILNANDTVFGSAAVRTLLTNQFGVYVVKYDTNGFAQWVSIMDGRGDDSGRGVTLDTNGNIYVAGSFSGSALVPFSA